MHQVSNESLRLRQALSAVCDMILNFLKLFPISISPVQWTISTFCWAFSDPACFGAEFSCCALRFIRFHQMYTYYYTFTSHHSNISLARCSDFFNPRVHRNINYSILPKATISQIISSAYFAHLKYARITYNHREPLHQSIIIKSWTLMI